MSWLPPLKAIPPGQTIIGLSSKTFTLPVRLEQLNVDGEPHQGHAAIKAQGAAVDMQTEFLFLLATFLATAGPVHAAEMTGTWAENLTLCSKPDDVRRWSAGGQKLYHGLLTITQDRFDTWLPASLEDGDKCHIDDRFNEQLKLSCKSESKLYSEEVRLLFVGRNTLDLTEAGPGKHRSTHFVKCDSSEDETAAQPLKASFDGSSSDGPSFSCLLAKSPDEKSICSDPRLSHLDLALSTRFKQTKDRFGPAVALAIARNHLARRRLCRADKDCIARCQADAMAAYADLGIGGAASARPTDQEPSKRGVTNPAPTKLEVSSPAPLSAAPPETAGASSTVVAGSATNSAHDTPSAPLSPPIEDKDVDPLFKKAVSLLFSGDVDGHDYVIVDKAACIVSRTSTGKSMSSEELGRLYMGAITNRGSNDDNAALMGALLLGGMSSSKHQGNVVQKFYLNNLNINATGPSLNNESIILSGDSPVETETYDDGQKKENKTFEVHTSTYNEPKRAFAALVYILKNFCKGAALPF